VDAVNVAPDFDKFAVSCPGRFPISREGAIELCRIPRGGWWVDQKDALIAIDQDRIAVRHRLQNAAEADHSGQAQGAGKDGGVCGCTTLLRHESDHSLAVERGGFRGSQVTGDDDRGGVRQRLLQVEATVERASQLLGDVPYVGRPRLEHWIRRLLEHQGVGIEGLLDGAVGRKSFMDVGDGGLQEGGVLEHQGLSAEDLGLGVGMLVPEEANRVGEGGS